MTTPYPTSRREVPDESPTRLGAHCAGTSPTDGDGDPVVHGDALRSVCVEELCRILRVDPADFDGLRSFDDYGLASIDALVALGAISDRLGLDLPPELFFIHRTLDAALGAMAIAREPASHVGDVRSFWFPGGGILDEPLLIDARARLRDVSLFDTIQVGGWVRWHRQGSTIDDLVAAALARIQEAAPRGRLLLAGDSQGGQLAYATALAALACGREVAGLVLFDAAPDYSSLLPSLSTVGSDVLSEGAAMIRSADRPSLGTLKSFLAWHIFQLMLAMLSPQRLLVLARRLRFGLVVHPRVDRRLQALAFGVLWWNWLRTRRPPLDCPVVLLRSDDTGPEDLGWGSTLPRLVVTRVPGSHRGIFAVDHAPYLHRSFAQAYSALTGSPLPATPDATESLST